MEEVVVNLLQSQGVWASLFIFLFLHQLKENKQTRTDAVQREDKLIRFISDMSVNFERLAAQYSTLAEDVDYIKVKIAEGYTSPD